METDGNISLKQIAEMAGTSVTTVSRVINHNGRFSKETEEKVLSIINEYHYQPNGLARSLRMQKTHVIGLLVPDISNEFFSGMIWEIQTFMFERGYMTLICITNEDEEREKKQIKMLLEQQVDGIIFIGGSTVTTSVSIPAIYIDREPGVAGSRRKKNYIFIESDNTQGGYLAGRELLEKGVKTPAVVYYGNSFSTIQGRLKGFLDAFEEEGITIEESMLVETKADTLEQGALALKTILRNNPSVDGIFFTSDMMAVGAVRYCTIYGISVPGKLRIIGFDGIQMGDVVAPTLTTIGQDLSMIGKMATEQILALINKEDVKKKKIRVPVRLIKKETT